MNIENPFSVTKASHLTDAEILEQWVEFDRKDKSLLRSLASPVPAILVGGKGCGKTHMLRYYSFQLQRMRGAGKALSICREDGFIGI